MADSKRECFLRQTKLTLCDGQEYSFRALPFSPSTERMLAVLLGAAELTGSEETNNLGRGLEAMRQMIAAVSKSLSYDHDAETIEYLLENGVLPLTPDDPGHSELMEAMAAGMKG